MENKQVTLNEVYAKLIVLEKFMKKMNGHIEDLEFARRTEESYQRHEAGDFKVKSSKEFLKELKQW